MGRVPDEVEQACRFLDHAKARLAHARTDLAQSRSNCDRIRVEVEDRLVRAEIRLTESEIALERALERAAASNGRTGMAGHPSIWRTEPEGVLAAEVDGLRLVVQAPEEVGGLVRFLVLRRDGEGDTIVGSGTEDNVRAAMKAAIQMAERLLSRPLREDPA